MKNSYSAQPSSRLTKIERKKVVKQSVWYLVGAVTLGLVFIFVLLPGLIRLTTGKVELSNGVEDTLPPQTPVFTAPASATNSATLKITGFTEAESEVVLIANGAQVSSSKASQEGEFTFDIQLMEGENKVAAFAKDVAGNESGLSREYRVVLDSVAPELTLETPTDGQRVELRKNQTINVKGKTEPIAKIYLNDHFTLASSTGDFTTSYRLNEGENILKFRIIDEAGNQTEQEVKVSFSL